VQNGWIFKSRRGGCPFYIYLEDEEAGGIMAGVSLSDLPTVFKLQYCKPQRLSFTPPYVFSASPLCIGKAI
jgi:hypothetical protein